MTKRHEKPSKDIEKKRIDNEEAEQGSENMQAMEDELESVRSEAKEHYDKLLRVMAEFENFKKRISREQSEHLKYGNEKLIKALLPVLDDMERVLDHVPEDAADDVKAIADGVELVHKNFLKVLSGFGLKEVETEDVEFDPTRHEAVSHQPSKDHAPNEIVSVHRKGYWLKDRLLRPAMVTVSKGEE